MEMIFRKPDNIDQHITPGFLYKFNQRIKNSLIFWIFYF